MLLGTEVSSELPLRLVEGVGLFDSLGSGGFIKLGPLGIFGAILYLLGGTIPFLFYFEILLDSVRPVLWSIRPWFLDYFSLCLSISSGLILFYFFGIPRRFIVLGAGLVSFHFYFVLVCTRSLIELGLPFGYQVARLRGLWPLLLRLCAYLPYILYHSCLPVSIACSLVCQRVSPLLYS